MSHINDFENYKNPLNPDKQFFRNRGFYFEKLLIEILNKSSLNARTSYKAKGEQIDGSFIFNGRVFLLEAKWHSNELPASTIYSFKGKVDGKLIGTIGVFISMSGFSKDAIDALVLGKSLNIILFDLSDMEFAIEQNIPFKDILETKLRAAAEEGNVYYPYGTTKISHLSQSPNIQATDSISIKEEKIIIMCEGPRDRELLVQLTSRLIMKYGIELPITFIVSMGRMNIPKLGLSIRQISNSNDKIIIVADSDDDTENVEKYFSNNIEFSNWSSIIVDPELEAWIGESRSSIQQILGNKMNDSFTYHKYISEKMKNLDIEQLAQDNKSFNKYIDELRN